MNRYTDTTGAAAEAVPVLLEIDSKERAEDLVEGNLFSEEWAAQHNQEIWGTAPSGMYEALLPPLLRIGNALSSSKYFVKGQSINMKTINLLLLVVFWMNSSPLTAQNQNQPNRQTAEPKPAPAHQATPAPRRLEDDPHFKHLSPEGQHWVKSLMDRLDKATERHDIAAIDQLTLEVARKEVTGMIFCGAHIFNEGMFLDAIEFGHSKEHAFVARWLEAERGSSVVHTALFTEGRCLATDGSTLDGRSISKILPNSLAISARHGLVAYEALYLGRPGEGTGATGEIHRGVFIENRFFIDLNPRKASTTSGPLKDEARDFSWDDENERLVMRPGVFLPLTVTPAAAPKH